MSQNSTTTDQWLVFTLADQKYAIHVDCVRELTRSADHQIRSLPQTPDDIVGALSLRGRVITIRDLRTMINLPSLQKETTEVTEILDKREEDHINWIKELKSSVLEDREFTLTRDPHKCAFGKWYDALMADESALQMLTNSNFTLYRLIGQMGAPHKMIHAIADRVTDLVRKKEFDKAHALIEDTGEVYLGTMIALMHQIRSLLNELRKPLIVILEWQGRQLGIQVDSVVSVARLADEKISPLPERVGQSGIFKAMARTDDESGLMMLLDGTKLFDETDPNLKPPDWSQLCDESTESSAVDATGATQSPKAVAVPV
jgi:purine-binding chemotaxis protein CheW